MLSCLLILLVMHTSSDLVWEGTTEGHKHQKAEITGNYIIVHQSELKALIY